MAAGPGREGQPRFGAISWPELTEEKIATIPLLTAMRPHG
jgi:hypothetical protein